jgi:TusA-related sulfurtransferase
MRNCPSAVPSAKTTLARTAQGVELTITSDDEAARDRILALAQWHSTQREPIWGMPAHTGMHGGPGAVGFCPIIHVKTTVTHAEIPQGVRIRVTADTPSMVTFLQDATELRVRALLQPSS